jgi:Mg-chelatase subunit ChlD
LDVLNKSIDKLQANGGTNINAGLDLALKTIKDRKFSNKITSVFLLSDGQDRDA